MITDKIYSIEKLTRTVRVWQKDDLKVGFTNGCFDILHKGHVSYLYAAYRHVDKLILALNTDDSVRRMNKSEHRPLQDQTSRTMVAASLFFVDAVTLFDEDTPLDIIKQVQPNVLIKGGDYDATEQNPKKKTYIVGSREVKMLGGEILTIPLVDGYSTTSIEAKILKQ